MESWVMPGSSGAMHYLLYFVVPINAESRLWSEISNMMMEANAMVIEKILGIKLLGQKMFLQMSVKPISLQFQLARPSEGYTQKTYPTLANS
jgi:hypothetical protein